MKNLKSFLSLITIVSFFLLPIAPVFALGELPTVDLCPNIDGAQASIPTGMILDGSGNCVTPPPTDTTAPVISAVVSAGVTSSLASITWVTDELSTSTFEYGTSESYGSSASISGGLAIGGTAALTNLTPATTYYYCIHATDGSNNSSASCGHSFMTATPADSTPPVVSLATVTSLESTTATITWTTSELASAQVEYGTSTSYGSATTLNNNLALTHSVQLSVLTPNTLYHYQIKSADVGGNMTMTSDATFTTQSVSVQVTDTTPPVISGVATVSTLSTATTIGWTTNELATSTLEYGITTSYGSSATLDTTALLLHDATILGLTPNTTYHYCIHATDIHGNVANSCGHTFTTAVAPITPDTTPPVISNVTSLSLATTTATITWDTNEAAVSTLQYGTTTSYGSSATLSTSALIAHETTLTGLTSGTTYHYCVHAIDISGNVANSCSHSFTTATANVVTDTTPPNLTLVTVTPITTTGATVNFTTSEISNAQIEYGTTASYGTTTALDTNLALTHVVTLSNLTPNTLYHYRIRTGDQLGNETIGPDETFTTQALSLIESQSVMTNVNISGVEMASVSTSSVTINWNTNLSADSQVEYGDSQDFGSVTILDSTLGTTHSVIINNLTPNTNYIFRVKSKVAGASIATVSENYEFNTLSVATPVVAPANILSVLAGTPTSTTLSITWTTDKSTTSQVEYGISTSYGQATVLNSSMSTSHTANLTELTPSTIYHYRVKSVDEASNITYSEDYTFTTVAIAGNIIQAAPIAITTLTAPDYDQESANLVWHVGSASIDTAQQYDIRFSTSPITSQNWANATEAQSTPIYYGDLSPNGTERSYIVAGLSHNTTYYFALSSKFENTSYGDLSNIVSVKTTQNSSVNNEVSVGGSGGGVSGTSGGYGSASGGNNKSSYEPTLVKAEPVDGEIVFSWKNPGELNFVRTVVVRKEGAYPTAPTDGTTIYEGRSETFTDTNIQNGKTYFYAIYSYNHDKTYSSAVKISLAPSALNKEVKFDESGFISPLSPIEHFTRVFKKGDINIEIEHLQEILALHGYPQNIIDGKFGALTEKALRSFQLKHNPPPTGIVDSATQKELNTMAQSETKLDIPEEYSIFDVNLKLGNKNENVRALQQYLVYEGSLSADAVDGSYGQKTKAAVTAFQKKYNLTPDGSTGPKTRHKMRQLSGL
jgi:peptidoglycan hydrolase-like protein with peptidoglycan-binding domain/phosphodiesterase/alkaline phosphatase D-like protein